MRINLTHAGKMWLAKIRKTELPSDAVSPDSPRPQDASAGVEVAMDGAVVRLYRDGDTVFVVSDAALELRGSLNR